MDESANEREGSRGGESVPLELDVNDDDEAMLTKLVDDYHRTLLGDRATLKLLAEHGVTIEAVRHLRLGLGNRTLGPPGCGGSDMACRWSCAGGCRGWECCAPADTSGYFLAAAYLDFRSRG